MQPEEPQLVTQLVNKSREKLKTAKAEELKPDLILLDFSMPVMNGLEAARELKRLMPSVLLVMFTNYGTDYLEKESLSAGVNAMVSKSDSKTLVSSIQALLESPS